MFQSPPTSLTTTNQSENQLSFFQIKRNIHGSGKSGMQHDGAPFFWAPWLTPLTFRNVTLPLEKQRTLQTKNIRKFPGLDG